MDKSLILDYLNNAKKTSTGQYQSDCPFCGKESHFYLNPNTYLWDCKKCSEAGNFKKLAKRFKLDDLFFQTSFKPDQKLPLLGLEQEDEEDEELFVEEMKLPRGFRRIKKSKYLRLRHFTKEDFERHRIGKTILDRQFRDYIIFSIDEEKKCRGVVGRLKPDFESEQRLRYINSKGTKFSKIIFGYDQVTIATNTVILTEGIFDQVRITNFFNLHDDSEMKAVACFGKKLSRNQLLKLKKKGVKDIIIAFDSDAVFDAIKMSNGLIKEFDTVMISVLPLGDPSSVSEEILYDSFINLKRPFEAHYSLAKKV